MWAAVRREPRELIGAGVPQRGVRRRNGGGAHAPGDWQGEGTGRSPARRRLGRPSAQLPAPAPPPHGTPTWLSPRAHPLSRPRRGAP